MHGHIALAFAGRHSWSHEAAVRETARPSPQVQLALAVGALAPKASGTSGRDLDLTAGLWRRTSWPGRYSALVHCVGCIRGLIWDGEKWKSRLRIQGVRAWDGNLGWVEVQLVMASASLFVNRTGSSLD